MNPPSGNSDARKTIRDWLQFYLVQQPFTQFDLATVQFLKVRYVAGHQVHDIIVQDTTGQRWHFRTLLEQKEGVWVPKTFDGGPEEVPNEPPELHDCPWIRLEMLLKEDNFHASNEFYAFGEVLDKGHRIVHVRLRDAGGLVLESAVEDGMVLFWSEQLPTIPPIQLELFNDAGILISRQTEKLGSPPSVMKEI